MNSLLPSMNGRTRAVASRGKVERRARTAVCSISANF